MIKHKFYPETFGLTQFEIASLLNVSRSHWSHFVRNVKNLSSKSNLLLSEMTLFMLSDEAKAVENLPSTEIGERRAKDVFHKKQDEIEFQLEVISKKINKEKELKERFLKAVQTTEFLSKTAVRETKAPHKLLHSIAELAEMNLQDVVFRLNCLQDNKQLLQVQYDWLKNNEEKL
ncbi:hypothetical protein [Flavobacterium sp.]|uniref:hypothetical protein n=1 Tax=Flavobacterium sp. TaxID=239 RepID=UPI0024881FDB|nr:hypothetical protein [Flavobacterium sp.]MDI1317184.1 hypothetical protein [Flavobacterium sp.]